MKKLKVVILPQDKIGWDKGQVCKCISRDDTYDSAKIGTLSIAQFSLSDRQSPYWQAQQVLLIDDKAHLIEGDMCVSARGEIFKATTITKHPIYGDKKIIATHQLRDGTLPISPETMQQIVECNGDCIVEVEVYPDMDYVGSNSEGRDQYVQVEECYDTSDGFIKANIIKTQVNEKAQLTEQIHMFYCNDEYRHSNPIDRCDIQCDECEAAILINSKEHIAKKAKEYWKSLNLNAEGKFERNPNRQTSGAMDDFTAGYQRCLKDVKNESIAFADFVMKEWFDGNNEHNTETLYKQFLASKYKRLNKLS